FPLSPMRLRFWFREAPREPRISRGSVRPLPDHVPGIGYAQVPVQRIYSLLKPRFLLRIKILARSHQVNEISTSLIGTDHPFPDRRVSESCRVQSQDGSRHGNHDA